MTLTKFDLRWDSDWKRPPESAELMLSEARPSLAGDPETVILNLVAENTALREVVESVREDVREYRSMVSVLLERVVNLQRELKKAANDARRVSAAGR